MTQQSRTGFVWHETFMWHDQGSYAGVLPPGGYVQPGRHFDTADTKRRFKNLLDASGLGAALRPIAPRAATDEELLRVHSREYLQRVKDLSAAGGGDAGFFAPIGRGGFEIAARATGGVISAVEAVVRGEVRNAYALVRPAGHHAEPDLGKGFCIFGNVAITARHARTALAIERVAIVDWDVHHGNGAQKIFWTDPTVLTISVHQDRSFPPDSGFAHEIGAGAGAGYNINIPLPAGCGHGTYVEAFSRCVLPALRAFRPGLILVSCGFDAGAMDPLGRMVLHSETFRQLTAFMMEVADETCGGRLVLAHEGGYSEPMVPFLGLAVVEQLAGTRSGVEDPFLPIVAADPAHAVLPHHELAIAQAEIHVRRLAASVSPTQPTSPSR